MDFIKNLPKKPIVSAFTATATEEVKENILCILQLVNPNVIVTGFDRENLYYSVENIRRKEEFVKFSIETRYKDETIWLTQKKLKLDGFLIFVIYTLYLYCCVERYGYDI